MPSTSCPAACRRFPSAKKGCMSPVLPAKRLVRRIEEVLGDSEMQKRAGELGEQFRAEDGAGLAVKTIEEHAASLGIASAPPTSITSNLTAP